MYALRRLGQASILALSLATLSLAQQPAPFHWETDVEAAKRLAAQTNRLVLVHFGATWCPPCMRLEEQVFSNPAFGPSISGQYVAVKLNYDQNKKLADQFAIQSIPADVILTPQGQLVQKLQSPQGLKDYVGIMQQIAHPPTQPGSPPPTAVATGGAGYIPPANPATSDNRYADYYNRRQEPTSAVGAPPYGAPPPATAATSGPPAASTPPSVAAQPAVTQNPWTGAAPPAGPPGVATTAVNPFAQAGSPPPAQQNTAPPPAAPASAGGLQLPPGCPALGLDGYCAVTLIEQRIWKAGDARYGAIHRNRTYIFAGPAEQQRFLANPDSYSPVMSGDDPVLVLDQNRAVPGLRKHGVFFGNRVYLFSSEQTLAEFARNTKRYAPEITQALLHAETRQ